MSKLISILKIFLGVIFLSTLSNFSFAKVSKIGVLAPMSGPAASDGESYVQGVTMAIEEINAAGGINGHTFEIVVADVKDQSSDSVLNAIEKLLNEKDINQVMTGYASLSNFELPFMAENEMPYFLAGNSQQTRDIIKPNPEDYWMVWSATPSYDAYETEMVPLVESLQAEGKLRIQNKKIALISTDNPYSKTIYNGLNKSFTAAGWEVTVTEMVPSGPVNDWRAILAKVRQDPPSVIVNTDWQPDNAARFITQFNEDPTDSLVFLQYGPSLPEFTELGGDDTTGVIYNLLFGHLPGTPLADQMIKKYEDRWNVQSTVYGIALYEMAMIYFDAVTASGGDPFNIRAVQDALSKTKKDVSQGVIQFDPETHLALQSNDSGIPCQFLQVWDGERHLFYPPKYVTNWTYKEPPWRNN